MTSIVSDGEGVHIMKKKLKLMIQGAHTYLGFFVIVTRITIWLTYVRLANCILTDSILKEGLRFTKIITHYVLDNVTPDVLASGNYVWLYAFFCTLLLLLPDVDVSCIRRHTFVDVLLISIEMHFRIAHALLILFWHFILLSRGS